MYKLQGCFLNNIDCQDKSECVGSNKTTQNLKFCCCEGNFCNKEFSWVDIPVNTTVHGNFLLFLLQCTYLYFLAPEPAEKTEEISVSVIIGTVILLVVFITVAIVSYFLYRKNKPLFNEV